MSATDNFGQAEKMIIALMDGEIPTKKALDICKWLLSFNVSENTHRVMCYKRDDPSIRFCFDRPGYHDSEQSKIQTVFLTIKPDLTIIFAQMKSNESFLKQDGQYHRINGGDARNISIDVLKQFILEAYCRKLKKYGLKSLMCGDDNFKVVFNEQNRAESSKIMHQPTKADFVRPVSKENLYDYYQSNNYFFSREILTRYFLSLKTKPFVILTGISGTGKTKIAQVFAEYMCQDEAPEERENRYAFVPVKPDWMDNKGLLGYYNLLDQKYYATKVLLLLLEAEENPEKPYFVILDEMNLAKVEQYFSDFLSIMESRTANSPQGEPLDLHTVSEAQTPDGRSVHQWFRIPPNVYFTGTVNVDESTYMFSPKVLDRANVIEFNDVDIMNYEKGIIASDQFVLQDQDVRQKLLPKDGEIPFCSKTDFMDALKTMPEVRDSLSKISGILHPYNLHFGYRVVNEISRYILNAHEMVQDFDLEETMDIQILQKILPKFHGTQAKLEEPLLKLLAFCKGEEGIPDESYLEKATAYDEEAPFPRSAQKLARMIQNLKIQGYTSFIE